MYRARESAEGAVAAQLNGSLNTPTPDTHLHYASTALDESAGQRMCALSFFSRSIFSLNYTENDSATKISTVQEQQREFLFALKFRSLLAAAVMICR